MKITTLIICLLAFNIQSYCQLENTPLKKWLTERYDTIVVIYTYSSWTSELNFNILANKQNKVDAFSYKNPKSIYYNIVDKDASTDDKIDLIKESSIFNQTVVDSNKYFNKHFTSQDILHDWNTINSFIWDISSESSNTIYTFDSTTGKQTYYSIFDSSEYKIFLLSKNQEKILYFYDPEGFEKKYPGNLNRMGAIKLIHIFNTYFLN